MAYPKGDPVLDMPPITLPNIRRRDYDIPQLSINLAELGYDLEYLPETASTMEDAKQFGLRKTVVLADHQTAGKGRYGRTWLDVNGESLLMTVVEEWGLPGDLPLDSLLPPQLFVLAACLAVRATASTSEIQIRWPNDLTARTKKMGGILIENLGGLRGARYPKLFGIGINVHERAEEAFPHTDYGAISLDGITEGSGPTREDLLLAIMKKWSSMRDDLRMMNSSRTFSYYQELWREHASLIDRYVQLTGIGKDRRRAVEGMVIDTPLGGGIVFETADGMEEIIEFNPESVITIRA